jgi:hypothetical protein
MDGPAVRWIDHGEHRDRRETDLRELRVYRHIGTGSVAR